MPYVFAILLLTAPLYVWRFSIGGLPTNFLMLWSFVVIVVAKLIIFKEHKYSVLATSKSYFKDVKSMNKMLYLGIVLICIASVISLFAFGFSTAKLGQWIVLYLEPISLFFIIRHFARRDTDDKYNVLRYVSLSAYLLLFLAGALAFLQYHYLFALPHAWWGNANEPKRAIAFFAHPNAYALFVTPLLAWLIPDVMRRFQKVHGIIKRATSFEAEKTKTFWLQLVCVAAWLVGAFGMFLTLSRGAWLALLVAAGLYVLLSANKKMFLWFSGALVAIAIIVAVTPNLRYRVMLPFYGEKSAAARISLFETGTKMVEDSPILGKGINGFDDNWTKYNTDPNLDHYNFPHNIFLNFWIDLGLLGLVGMILIFATGIWQGIKNRKNPLALGLLLFLVAITVHGLIDIPYLKNDLALVFWMVLALST
ncbi:MAG TPA: O-antigen ligase family protein [Patescibacteria group bacterium]|jgi:O-antigen ligase|nr:O-antigen ligase family protein [Patescibacteria group bacterium]